MDVSTRVCTWLEHCSHSIEVDLTQLANQSYDLGNTCIYFTSFTACTSGTADLVLVLDESSSVGRTNFKTVIAFAQNLVSGLSIGPTAVQVGCLTFASRTNDRFYLNEQTTQAALQKALERIRLFHILTAL